MAIDVKGFLGTHRVKISVIAGLVVLAAIGLVVGDLTIGQVMACVGSFDPTSTECIALGTPATP